MVLCCVRGIKLVRYLDNLFVICMQTNNCSVDMDGAWVYNA